MATVATLEGWGRLPVPGREVLSSDLERLTLDAALTRGLGRSYGDSSLPARPADKVAGTRLANRILAFDTTLGVLRAEAGLSLVELNPVLMSRGWFVPVTPGTKFVTLGGMVASDVHGKNHHRDGCFGAHVRALRIRLAEGDVVECSPSQHPDLFYASIGGNGLLGHILELEFSLAPIPTSWINMDSERVPGIDEFLEALTRGAAAYPMTMGWIDCVSRGRAMGRGILMAGRWATPEEVGNRAAPFQLELAVPFELPNWVLNRATSQAFNIAYYWRHFRRHMQNVVSPEPFFYPLDSVHNWNLGYGSRGFTQYQCVLPRAAGAPAVREFLARLTALGCASPLCVIKDCGPEGKGMLSFPLEGTSIAVDIPVSDKIQDIVDRLNEFVIAAGGRIYLTKDRFTRAEHFRAMEPRLDRFLATRAVWDPKRRLRSAQSVRLFGDRA
jgi:decaprenylphospho-beta-D-ribofuranose 2-oxidase